jgi:CheY-like chemotaxis protein
VGCPSVRRNRSLGYEATGAHDGASGLAAFEAAQHPFDLLLTDVIVPGPMNGKALADEVRRRWPDTKLVFMSGYSEKHPVDPGPPRSGRAAAQQAVPQG